MGYMLLGLTIAYLGARVWVRCVGLTLVALGLLDIMARRRPP